jgi:hypothetical protein
VLKSREWAAKSSRRPPADTGSEVLEVNSGSDSLGTGSLSEVLGLAAMGNLPRNCRKEISARAKQ